MPARKRAHSELEADQPSNIQEPGLLKRLRDTWQMASLMQFVYLFGDEFKIAAEFDMEALEEECLRHDSSQKLVDIGISFLKHITRRPGLTSELFDETVRQQYLKMSPETNPFGEEEEPKKFREFDVFLKLRILHQLTLWTMTDSERFRQKVEQLKESDQARQWRIAEFGWDADENPYYLLDDSRLYRRTPGPTPPPTPPPVAKSKSKSKTQPRPRPRGTRSSKRRRISYSSEPDGADEIDGDIAALDEMPMDNGLGGDKWECVCVTLEEYQEFAQALRKSRDPNERAMYNELVKSVIPRIEELDEERARKLAKRERELLTLEKLASAKRSSRIASRLEREKEETAVREAEEKRRRDLAAARKDAERQQGLDEARRSRMMTREQRLKEREYKRILHEDELQKMATEQERMENGELESKKSERQLKADMRKAREALQELENGDDEWTFDCAGCGVHGQNIDDGKHSIACERCNVWQHSACLGLSQEEAERDDFVFVCRDCKRKEDEARQREEDARRPKIPPLRFRIGAADSPSRPKQEMQNNEESSSIEDTIVLASPRYGQGTGRKSADGEGGENENCSGGMPPEKRFKSYMPKPVTQLPNGTGSGTSASPLSTTQLQANGYPIATDDGIQTIKNTGGHAPETPAQSQEDRSPMHRYANGGGISTTAALPNGASILTMPPPPLQATPTSSFVARSPNTSFSQPNAPSTPSHPLVPQKQPSAAPSPAPSTSLQASSPAIKPPMRLDASFSGISPVKNSSPPQPLSRSNSFSNLSALQNVPILPPVEKLDAGVEVKTEGHNASSPLLHNGTMNASKMQENGS